MKIKLSLLFPLIYRISYIIIILLYFILLSNLNASNIINKIKRRTIEFSYEFKREKDDGNFGGDDIWLARSRAKWSFDPARKNMEQRINRC